jgi:hypothetical protein
MITTNMSNSFSTIHRAAKRTAALSATIILACASFANASVIHFAGSTAGVFGSTGTSVVGGLSYFGSTFNANTSSSGYLGLGGKPSPGTDVNNLGSLVLTNAAFNYAGESFTLSVNFTDPSNITPSNPAVFAATLIGDVDVSANGGVTLNFNHNLGDELHFAFSDSIQGDGTFTFSVNDLAIFPDGRAAAINGQIVAASVAIPEVSTIAPLGLILVAAGAVEALRRRSKTVTA